MPYSNIIWNKEFIGSLMILTSSLGITAGGSDFGATLPLLKLLEHARKGTAAVLSLVKLFILPEPAIV